MKKIMIAVASCLLAGCNLNTQTQIAVTMPNGAVVKYTSPKDVQTSGLEIIVNTNGTLTARVKSWNASNNPQVLNAAGNQDVAVINAVGTQVMNGVTTGMAAASTGGASAAIPAAAKVIGK